ncbi:hypothetical protein PATSB16_24890 [Pandoraea thiooxydans]|nr:hypothetical protein PATSB16_24890 [Pandoraea thiooxydans]
MTDMRARRLTNIKSVPAHRAKLECDRSIDWSPELHSDPLMP